MKLLNKLSLLFTGLTLSLGCIAGSAFECKQEKANAAPPGDFTGVFAEMNENAPKFIQKSDNPDKWSSSESENYVKYSDLSSTNDTTLSINAAFSGNGTTALSITENSSTRDFVCAYVPFVLYAHEFPALSVGTYLSVDFTIIHDGWSSKNYSNVSIMYLGNDANNITNINTFYTGKTEGGAISETEKLPDGENYKLVGYTGDEYTIIKNVTQSINLSSISNVNTDGKVHNSIVGYYALFVYARKDNYNTHQLSVSLSAKVRSEVIRDAYASLDGKGYANVYSLFANCKADGTSVIKLLQDIVEDTSILSTPYSVTLDLNSKTYTLMGSISVNSGSTITVKNGTIRFASSSSNVSLFTVDNTSTLICDNVTLDGSEAPQQTNKLIKNNGTTKILSGTYTTGAYTYTYLIENNKNMYVSGGSFASGTSGYEFYNYGNLYLSGTPSINRIWQLSNGVTYGASSATGTDYYTGNTINLTLSYVPEFGQVVCKNFNADIINLIIYSFSFKHKFEGKYDSTKKEVSVVGRSYSITFNITNLTHDGDSTLVYGNAFTCTLIALEGYKLPTSIEMKINSSTYNGYTYNSLTGVINIPETADITGSISINAAGVAITKDDIITKWAKDYLHMDDYNTNSDYCKDSTHHYYLTAKTELLKLDAEVIEYFQTIESTNSNYAARMRYEAWAIANNDIGYCYTDDFSHIKSVAKNAISAENFFPIEIAIALTAILGLSGLLLLKKKHN